MVKFTSRCSFLVLLLSRVQDIDPFIGMVTEEPIPGAAVGRTAGCIIARQFYAFKYGDRFWYENNVGDQKFEGGKNTETTNTDLFT